MPLSSLLRQPLPQLMRCYLTRNFSSVPDIFATRSAANRNYKKKRKRRNNEQWVELIQEVGSGFWAANKGDIVKKRVSGDVALQLGIRDPKFHQHESVINRLRIANDKFKAALHPLLVKPSSFVPRTQDPRMIDVTPLVNEIGHLRLFPLSSLEIRETQTEKAVEEDVGEVPEIVEEMYNNSSNCYEPAVRRSDVDTETLCADLTSSKDDYQAEPLELSSLQPIPVPMIHESPLELPAQIKVKLPVKKLEKRERRVAHLHTEDQEKLAKIKREEMEKMSKEVNLSFSLRAYLDVCIHAKMVNRAYATLLYYASRNIGRPNLQCVKDIRSYNMVLNALAEKGNYAHIMELLSLMRREHIRLNAHSFSSILLCLSYATSPNVATVKSVLEDMERNEIALSSIFHSCLFVKDHRERILRVIRLVHPDFQPSSPEIPNQYSNQLAISLNEPVPLNRQYSPAEDVVSPEDLRSQSQIQWERELAGYVTVRSIEKQEPDTDRTEMAKGKFQKWESAVEKSVTAAYTRKLRKLHDDVRSQDRSINLLSFLSAVDTSVYVNVIMQEIRLLSELPDTFSPPLFTLQSIIGLKLMSRYQVQKKQSEDVVKKLMFLYEKYCDYYMTPDLTSKYTPRQYWNHLLCLHPEGPSVDTEDRMWPYHVLVGVGQFLYDIILNDVKINANILKSSKSKHFVPAFFTVYRHQGLHLREEVKCHSALHQLRKLAGRDTLTFEASLVPMLSPPLPWSSVRTGGFLMSSAKFIRLPHLASAHRFQLDRTPAQQLYPILDSLNQLSECPWIINQTMLDVVTDVFNSGGDMSLDIPPPPSHEPLPSIHAGMSKTERSKAFRLRLKVKQQRAEMYSLWCDALYKLSIANHFRDEVFWFPHNLDFRGRTYPCPPHFNHLGSDLTRSILLFAKGQPLGKEGLNWLKKHVINLTGQKKRDSVEERLRYANAMLPEIIDSAEKPFTGNRWWMKSDEPWQTLACCKEIVKAMQHPDPAQYVCHFPVHQDGSCNGLQHYAALGRDQHGAEQVNLAPSHVPRDVYSGVAALVEVERVKDASNGVEIAQLLDGFVRRKVIKQTVMTTVYGVTAYGARLQILKQLKDIPDFPQDKVWSAASYLTKKTFYSLRQMFTATKQIQDWFTESARLISHIRGQPVEWITPLGLPIIQPYHRPLPSSKITPTGPLSKRPLATTDMFERPNVLKQKNAFPPNFIHSLDSTHMMLTSLHCQRAGITFVSVHDCFWTHPSTVETMNRICREQFVALHNQPILESLSEYLVNKFSFPEHELQNEKTSLLASKKLLNDVLTQVPKKGEFHLDQVLHSTYFFS